MRYGAREAGDSESAALHNSLQKVLSGLGFKLVEFTVSKHKGSVQARAVIYSGGTIGTPECSAAHRAIMPPLELEFPGRDIRLEVSSPGINRLIKSASEFAFYTGRGVNCYCSDISDWRAGILEESDEKGIVIKNRKGALRLEYEIIAKAKLDSVLEYELEQQFEQKQEVGIGN